MHQSLVNLEIKVLEKMYLKEVEILKLQLLSGAFGRNMKKQRDKTLLLANIIHEKQFGTVPLAFEHI